MPRFPIAACLAVFAASVPTASLHAQRSGGYSLRDVEPHAIADDCWIVLDRGVYVITDYLPEHRGAPDDLVSWCGTDASAALDALGKDGRKLRQRIAEYRIGTLDDEAG